jgi:integrase
VYPKAAERHRWLWRRRGQRDLRHPHATQLLKAGVQPKVVPERLGHASIGIALDTYSHVMPGMQEEAAEKIDAGLRAALAG